jgi:hypothetical protein
MCITEAAPSSACWSASRLTTSSVPFGVSIAMSGSMVRLRIMLRTPVVGERADRRSVPGQRRGRLSAPA